MRSPVPDYLSEVLDDCLDDASGAVADYVPELARADPDRLGAAVATVSGTVHVAGDSEARFTIQSISKPFAYALALADRGFDAVLEKVDVEPSGEAFNELSLESGTGRPRNPMINAGAITVSSLVGAPGSDVEAREERTLAGLSAFAGRELTVDEAVYDSEIATAHRNLSIAHMLRSHGVLTEDPVPVVRSYIRACAVLVDVCDLALMAATLANEGVHPVTGERVVGRDVVRQVLSLMATCGMYDAAGDWISTVGIPAKSGVAGGLIGALPGQVGLATFSPRLDAHGNSVRGVKIFERLSADMGMHLMEVSAPARSVVRSDGAVTGADGDPVAVYELQGTIQFSGAEQVLTLLESEPPTAQQVLLDLSRVHSVNDVARRMLLEAVRRLVLDGHRVALVDPEQTLPDPEAGDGIRPTVLTSRPPMDRQ